MQRSGIGPLALMRGVIGGMRRSRASYHRSWLVRIAQDGMLVELVVLPTSAEGEGASLRLDPSAAEDLGRELRTVARTVRHNQEQSVLVPPDLIGADLTQARTTLRMLGFPSRVVDVATHDEVSDDDLGGYEQVTALEPPGGTIVPVRSLVTITAARRSHPRP